MRIRRHNSIRERCGLVTGAAPSILKTMIGHARRRLRPALATLLASLAALATMAPSGAASPSQHDTLLVHWRADASPAERANARREVRVSDRNTLDRIGFEVLRVQIARGEALERLRSSGLVREAYPNRRVERAVSAVRPPDDPHFPEQWHLHNSGYSVRFPADADVDAPEAWLAAYGRRTNGVIRFPASPSGPSIAVIDSGIQLDHLDFQGQVVGCAAAITGMGTLDERDGACSDTDKHGTMVAGVAAAATGNDWAVASIAPRTPLLVCRVFPNSTDGAYDADIAACIDWSVRRGARAINMSFGSTLPFPGEQAASELAWAAGNGPLLVAAAGNSGRLETMYPAGFPSVVSVGASDSRDCRAAFSTYNSDIELVAPGEGITSTGGWGSGTSFAAPAVTGAAALLLYRDPTLTGAQLRAALGAAVDDIGPAGFDIEHGHGRLNVHAALTKVAPLTGRGTIIGRVTNAAGQPRALVRVGHEPRYCGEVLTDTAGFYRIEGAIAGSVQVTVPYDDGFWTPCTQAAVVDVRADQTTQQDFQLKPNC